MFSLFSLLFSTAFPIAHPPFARARVFVIALLLGCTLLLLVPLHWYDEYDHIGYNREGGKVMKRADGSGNGIDAALNARDDPNYARTVYDAYNDREVSFFAVLNGCCKGVARVLHGCCKGATRVLQGCYKGVTRVLRGCCKGVARVLQGCCKGVATDACRGIALFG